MRTTPIGLLCLLLMGALLSCAQGGDDDVADDDIADDDVSDDDTSDDDGGDDDATDDDGGDDDATDDDGGDDDASDDDVGDDDVSDDDGGDDDVSDDDVGDDDSGDDDTVFSCGTIGQPCSIPSQCDPGQTCFLSGNGGVCGIDRLGCGGFVPAPCKDPSAPICVWLESTDYGLCASADEKDCICNTTPYVVVPGIC